MPKAKKAPTGPDTRSRDRKAIDRARSFVDRLRLLTRNGPANLEDGVSLAQDGGVELNTDEHKALGDLIDEAEKIMLYLPTVVRMIEMIRQSVLGKQTDQSGNQSA